MVETIVREKLRHNYAHYYEGKSAWRAIGAVSKVQNITRLCEVVPHDRILEIGSGEGAILQRLAEVQFGVDLYSIEISESAVSEVCSRNIPAVRECRLFDGYEIPYVSHQFDLAILSHVLEHVEYPRRLLYEASRVAEHVFVEVPLEDTLRLKGDFVFDHVGHINFYSWKTIRRLVQTCDMKILSQVITNPSLPTYTFISGKLGYIKYGAKESLLRLARPLAAKVFTYHCALLCRKDDEFAQSTNSCKPVQPRNV